MVVVHTISVSVLSSLAVLSVELRPILLTLVGGVILCIVLLLLLVSLRVAVVVLLSLHRRSKP